MAKALFVFFIVIVPGAAFAQDAGPTRIAVINLGEVFLNFEKAKNHKKDLDAFLAPYKAASEKLRDEVAKQQQIASDQKNDMDVRNAATQKGLLLRRKIEDLELEVRKMLGKKQEQSIVDLYSEMRAAIEKHAEANNIDLVLVYGDPVKKEDLDTFANISRKMQAADQGGVVPIFIRPRIDITQAIIARLNKPQTSKK